MNRLFLIAAASVALWGCGGRVSAVGYGAQLFSDPGFSDSQFNAFSCATCHAAEPPGATGAALPGYSMVNSAFRAGWWGGSVSRFADAVDFCYRYFMRGSALDVEAISSKALYEYLVSISPEQASPALPFTIVQNVEDVPNGDGARGRQVYDASCRPCHGELGTGRGAIAPSSLLPDIFATYDTLFPGVPRRIVVIEKVRHGRFFGVGGVMPLYSLEALSDQDLGALLSFLAL